MSIKGWIQIIDTKEHPSFSVAYGIKTKVGKRLVEIAKEIRWKGCQIS